jgi:hypothetical protein
MGPDAASIAPTPGPVQPGQRPEPPEQEKALARDWLKRIDAALQRPAVKDAQTQFEKNRRLLRGQIGTGADKKRLRSNLYFANLAMMRPQVYAKDPEYAVTPTLAVPEAQLELIRAFGTSAEAVLHQTLIRDCRLKQKAKRLTTAAYTTSIGWLKVSWQEDVRRDVAIMDRLKDTQDNLQRLQVQRQALEDPSTATDMDLQLAQLQQTVEGLQGKAEVTVSRGPALDFVYSEDVIVLDQGIRELVDYRRSGAMAHRVWMTRKAYEVRFGYDPKKATTFSEQSGQAPKQADTDRDASLLQVFEVWDQDSNRVLTVCSGEEGLCCPPQTPDWTGKVWYPFFLLAWNEVDGSFYPLSDVELIEPLVTEYNEQRDDFVKDRRACRPLNIARKGGVLTEEDSRRVANRDGGDFIFIEGVGNRPITDDIWSGQLGTIDPKNYDTAPARADIEQLIGGGDAARGSVLQAKTATEAEILSQGLRGRSAERTDVIEDLMTDLGTYTLQMCLRKLTPDEVKRIAGPDAVWPELSADEIFDMVNVEVRAGSTGRPDRLQEQDRWTKLQPVIEKTISTVSELYANGQVKLGQALVEILRETLRRFDERIDLDALLPKAPEGGEMDPAMLMQQNQQLKAQVQELTKELLQAKTEQEKGYVTAATSIATSAQPLASAAAFGEALNVVRSLEQQPTAEETPPQLPQDPNATPQSAPPLQ